VIESGRVATHDSPASRDEASAGSRPQQAATAIVAPSGESAAAASRPDNELESARYNIYEANLAPWWLALVWAAFFVFAVTYLIVNLSG
jgi:hypothetical protein